MPVVHCSNIDNYHTFHAHSVNLTVAEIRELRTITYDYPAWMIRGGGDFRGIVNHIDQWMRSVCGAKWDAGHGNKLIGCGGNVNTALQGSPPLLIRLLGMIRTAHLMNPHELNAMEAEEKRAQAAEVAAAADQERATVEAARQAVLVQQQAERVRQQAAIAEAARQAEIRRQQAEAARLAELARQEAIRQAEITSLMATLARMKTTSSELSAAVTQQAAQAQAAELSRDETEKTINGDIEQLQADIATRAHIIAQRQDDLEKNTEALRLQQREVADGVGRESEAVPSGMANTFVDDAEEEVDDEDVSALLAMTEARPSLLTTTPASLFFTNPSLSDVHMPKERVIARP